MGKMDGRSICDRCSAPLPLSAEEGELHTKCRMIREMGDTSCVNCGGSDVAFTLLDGNLIQYHEDCGSAAMIAQEE